MAEKKSLFHSELSKLGPIQVTVKTDVLQSKFQGKPNYVVLECDGVERNYSCENAACEAALRGLRGRTVTVEATGSRDDAAIIVHGNQPAAQPAPAAQTQQAPARPAATAPAPAAKGPRIPMGATVGMAVNNACNSLTAQGEPLEPHAIFNIASDILRVCYNLEDGKLAPTFAERQAAAAPQM